MTPIKNLRAVMARLKLNAVLITDEKNQQYLSGFSFTDAIYLAHTYIIFIFMN
jgi:Xaa-Pro aminopeptidase